jgi:hypothetical protein
LKSLTKIFIIFTFGCFQHSCNFYDKITPNKTVIINESNAIKSFTVALADSIILKEKVSNNYPFNNKITLVFSQTFNSNIIKPKIELNEDYTFEEKNSNDEFITSSDLVNGFDFYKKRRLKIYQSGKYITEYYIQVKFNNNLEIEGLEQNGSLIAGKNVDLVINLKNLNTVDTTFTTFELIGGRELQRTFIKYNVFKASPQIVFPIRGVFAEGDYTLYISNAGRNKVAWKSKITFQKGEIYFNENTTGITRIDNDLQKVKQLLWGGYFHIEDNYEVEFERRLPDRKVFKRQARYENVSSISIPNFEELEYGAYKLNFYVNGQIKFSSLLNKVTYGYKPHISFSSEELSKNDIIIVKLWNSDICLQKNDWSGRGGFFLKDVNNGTEYNLEVDKMDFCGISWCATAYLKVPKSIPSGNYYFKYYVCGVESYDWWTTLKVL